MSVVRKPRSLVLLSQCEDEGSNTYLGYVEDPDIARVLVRGVDEAILDEARQRIQAMLLVGHDAIVPVYDLVERDDGHWLIEGMANTTALSTILTGPLPLDVALYVTDRVLDGLEAMHCQTVGPSRAPLLHLAISPHAVRLAPDGEVRLGRMSLSSRPQLTERLRRCLPPELLINNGRRSPPTDLFGVGCMLYEMLVGRPLFEGDHRADVAEKLSSVSLTEHPHDIIHVLARLLRLTTDQRTPSAAEARSDLQQCWPQLGALGSGDAARSWLRERFALAVEPAPMSTSAEQDLGALELDDVEWYLDGPIAADHPPTPSPSTTPVTDHPPTWSNTAWSGGAFELPRSSEAPPVLLIEDDSEEEEDEHESTVNLIRRPDLVRTIVEEHPSARPHPVAYSPPVAEASAPVESPRRAAPQPRPRVPGPPPFRPPGPVIVPSVAPPTAPMPPARRSIRPLVLGVVGALCMGIAIALVTLGGF